MSQAPLSIQSSSATRRARCEDRDIDALVVQAHPLQPSLFPLCSLPAILNSNFPAPQLHSSLFRLQFVRRLTELTDGDDGSMQVRDAAFSAETRC